jgi:hypothetical protein
MPEAPPPHDATSLQPLRVDSTIETVNGSPEVSPEIFLRNVRHLGASGFTMQGGTGVWQYLLRKGNLMATGEPWTAVFTNEPPTERDIEVIDAGAGNGKGFYRVRAERK